MRHSLARTSHVRLFALPHRINSMVRAWHFCFTASTYGAHDPLELKVTPMYLYVCTLRTRLPKTKSLRLLVSLPEITITAILSGATLMHIRIFLAHFSRMAKLFWSLASESARSTMSSMYAKSIIRIEVPSGRSMSRPQSLSRHHEVEPAKLQKGLLTESLAVANQFQTSINLWACCPVKLCHAGQTKQHW